MGKFVTIGERLSTTAPAVNKAFLERDPEPILKRAKQQLDAGATYLDVNIGPAEGYGPDLMKWAVELLQGEFDNVPLALDTSNKAAIEAGIAVYNRSKGKPIVNSADAADPLLGRRLHPVHPFHEYGCSVRCQYRPGSSLRSSCGL